MALMTVGFYSNSMHRRVQMTVILPVDKTAGIGWPDHDGIPYKTMYLLHGIMGDNLSWPSFSRVQRFAEDRNLAVVIPSGENGFYVDHPKTWDNYATFISEELVDVTRKMFPLSRKREDTFIGGFSMGGYGALRLGLLHPETFGAITAFSSGLLLDEYAESNFKILGDPAYCQEMFGDPDKVLESDLNPEWLIRQIKADGREMPKLYISIGDQDFLVKQNQKFLDFLDEEQVPYTFRHYAGGHDWDFWDSEIKYVIYNWLPVEPGLNGKAAEENVGEKKD